MSADRQFKARKGRTNLYYYRAVPVDLERRFGKLIQECLHTADHQKARRAADQQEAWARNRERAKRLQRERAVERECIRNLSPEQKAERLVRQGAEAKERDKEMRAFVAELEAERKAQEADPAYQSAQAARQAELQPTLDKLSRRPFDGEVPDWFLK